MFKAACLPAPMPQCHRMKGDGNDEDASGVSKDDVLPSCGFPSASVYTPSDSLDSDCMSTASSPGESNFGLLRLRHSRKMSWHLILWMDPGLRSRRPLAQ